MIKKKNHILIKYFDKILEKIDDNVSGGYDKIRLANNLLRYLENKTPTADIVILFNLIFNKIKNIDGLFLEESIKLDMLDEENKIFYKTTIEPENNKIVLTSFSDLEKYGFEINNLDKYFDTSFFNLTKHIYETGTLPNKLSKKNIHEIEYIFKYFNIQMIPEDEELILSYHLILTKNEPFELIIRNKTYLLDPRYYAYRQIFGSFQFIKSFECLYSKYVDLLKFHNNIFGTTEIIEDHIDIESFNCYNYPNGLPITHIFETEYDCLLPEELNSFYYRAKFSTLTDRKSVV